MGVDVENESGSAVKFENCFLALNLAGAGTERVERVPRGKTESGSLNPQERKSQNKAPLRRFLV